MQGRRPGILVALAGALIALSAPAAAVAAGPVVQQRQAGDRLVAHRYEAPAADQQTFSVAYTTSATPNSISAFDFDRDGRADAAIRIYRTSLTSGAYRADIHDLRTSGVASTCLAHGAGTFVAQVNPTESLTTNRRLVSFGLPAQWRSTFGEVVRYAPRVVTWAGDDLGGTTDADTTARDYLPNAGGPSPAGGADTRCTVGSTRGQRVYVDQGTDRGQSGSPARIQRMFDLAGDAGDTDLLGVRMDQWDAVQSRSNATNDADPGTDGTQPTDVLLTFAGDATTAPLDTATYVLPGTTASESPQAPIGLLTTSRVDQDTVAVGLWPAPSVNVSATSACFPYEGDTAQRVLVELPIVVENGRPTVRVAIDRLLGIYQASGFGGSPNVADVEAFRWVTASRNAGQLDYAPDFSGHAEGSTSGFTTCANGSGFTVQPRRTARFARAGLPSAGLSVSPPAPQRGQQATLTGTGAGSGGRYHFDATGSSRFVPGPQTGSTTTATYFAPTTARVVAEDSSGTHQMAATDVTPTNAPPEARFTPRDASYALSCRPPGGFVTVTFTSTSTDEQPPLASQAWTLRRGTEPVATGSGGSFSRTLTQPGAYTVSLTVTDGEGTSDTETHAFSVVDPGTECGDGPPAAAIAQADPPAGRTVFARRPVTFSAAASQVPQGPPAFAWDLDGDGGFETDTGDQATVKTTYDAPGARTVRVRVRDRSGRESVATLPVDVRPEPNLPPRVVLSAPESLTLGDGPATATLDASGSTGQNEDPALSFAWDLDGDGSFERSTGAEPRVQVAFASRGARTVRVRATDVYGNQGTAQREIVVRDAVDVQQGCEGRQSFRTVAFGPVRAAACWTRVDRPNAGPLWFATGNVDLNGLQLTGADGSTAVDRTFPDCSGACAAANGAFNEQSRGLSIVLDPYDGKLVSNSPVALRARGADVNLPLSLTPIDVTLPFSPRDDGFIVRVPSGSALFSLPVSGEAEVRFPAPGATTVRLNVEMPSGLPGVSGAAEVQATPAQGVVVDRLRVDVGSGLLGGRLLIKELGFEYARADRLWRGNAKITIPAPRPFDLGVAVSVRDNRFQSVFGEVDNLNQPLGKGIFLQRVAAGVALDPLDLTGGLGLSAGPRIRDFALLRLDGGMRLRFPSPAAPYHLFQLTGEATIARTLPLANAFVQVTDSGFVEARGGIGGDYSIGYFRASVGGWIAESAANFDGTGEAGLLIDGRRVAIARARAVLSSVGVAACGDIPVINLGGGIGARWSNMEVATFWGCDLGPYSVARPADAPPIPAGFARAAQAPRRGHAVTLPRGLRSAALEVRGRGGVPRFRVVDGRGRPLVDATREHLTPRSMVVHDATTGTASLLWKAPPAGRAFVVAEPGSPPIASVRSALGAPPPVVRASVGRARDGQRELRWRVRPALQRGQRLVLAEVAARAGGQPIATTTRSRGSVRFTPGVGPRGTRRVQATIVTDGLGRPPQTVASFPAPRAVAPAAVRGLALRRRGRAVEVRWARTAGARGRRARVELRAGTGRTVLREVAATRRRLRLGDVPAALPVRVTVRVLGATPALVGRPATARIAAGAVRSGRAAAADARPRRVRVRRAGRRLVVSWAPGPERVRAFTVVVRPARGRPVTLAAHPRRPRVVLARAPRGRVRVEVRALRFSGRPVVARAG